MLRWSAMLWAAFCCAMVAAQDRPNILFCISDDQSWLHAGAYGCRWVQTPAFDRVAREGLLFRNAYTPNAKCAPSRACILTGRNTWQLEQACNHWPHFPVQFTSYVEALTDAGYHTGSTGKGWAPGIAKDVDGNPRSLTGQTYNRRQAPPPTKSISNNDYAANFADFLNDSGERPWCFWYGSTEPHRRYEYGSGVKVGGKSIADIDEVPPFWPDNEVTRNDMLDYALEIEHFDRHLGRMLQQLESAGQLKNTLIIVTADNGMPFPRIKGQEYEFSNHLPLAIMWPDGIRQPGRIIEDLVSFVDFAPTILQAAGLSWQQSQMAATVGRPLQPIFSQPDRQQVHREFVVFGKERHDIGRPDDHGYPIRAITDGQYLYIRNFESARWPAGHPATGYLNCDGSPTKTEILNGRRYGTDTAARWQLSFGKRPAEELYRLTDDRYCMHNLAATPAFDDVRENLRERLTKRLREEGDPRLTRSLGYFEKFPYAHEGGRNFYNRFMNGEPLKAGWVNQSDFETEPIER